MVFLEFPQTLGKWVKKVPNGVFRIFIDVRSIFGTGLFQNKQPNLTWDPSSPKDGPKTKPGTSETHRVPRGNVPVAYVPGTSIWGSVGVLEAAHFRAKK